MTVDSVKMKCRSLKIYDSKSDSADAVHSIQEAQLSQRKTARGAVSVENLSQTVRSDVLCLFYREAIDRGDQAFQRISG